MLLSWQPLRSCGRVPHAAGRQWPSSFWRVVSPPHCPFFPLLAAALSITWFLLLITDSLVLSLYPPPSFLLFLPLMVIMANRLVRLLPTPKPCPPQSCPHPPTPPPTASLRRPPSKQQPEWPLTVPSWLKAQAPCSGDHLCTRAGATRPALSLCPQRLLPPLRDPCRPVVCQQTGTQLALNFDTENSKFI